MIVPKFDVGDVLRSVLDDTHKIKLHVVEVHTQKCAAMIEQITYCCRVYTQRFKDDAPSITRDLYRYNEMEVVKWEPKEKTD